MRLDDTGISPQARLARFPLHVDEIEATADFYVRAFGLRLPREDSDQIVELESSDNAGNNSMLDPLGRGRKRGQTLAKMVFDRQRVNSRRFEQNLSGQKPVKTNLSSIRLRSSILGGGSLWGAILKDGRFNVSALTDVLLDGAHLTNAMLSRANIGGTSEVSAVVSDAQIENAILTSVQATGFETGSNMRIASLSGSDFLEAKLDGADLSDGPLTNIILHETYFWGANFFEVNLEIAELAVLCLVGAYIGKAVMIGANLSGTDPLRADLHYANLRDANLRIVILTEALLKGADLRGAKLNQILLSGAGLTRILLDNAIERVHGDFVHSNGDVSFAVRLGGMTVIGRNDSEVHAATKSRGGGRPAWPH